MIMGDGLKRMWIRKLEKKSLSIFGMTNG